MLNQLKNWQGPVCINDTHFSSFPSDLRQFSGDLHIKLYPKGQKSLESSNMKKQTNKCSTNEINVHENTGELKITVKAYMTRKSSPEFDFMAKWNNDNPMPFRTMSGVIEKETPGMYYMHLHGDIYADKTIRCMKCGKELKNPVSQYFGIGPECGGHNYVHPFNSDAELKEAVSKYKNQLQNVKWDGWVIKSAIVEKEEI